MAEDKITGMLKAALKRRRWAEKKRGRPRDDKGDPVAAGDGGRCGEEERSKGRCPLRTGHSWCQKQAESNW